MDGCWVLHVHVQPGAREDAAGGVHDGALKVRVTAPPVDGKANAAVVRVVAGALGVPQRAVRVVGGTRGRRKTCRVAGPPALGTVIAGLCDRPCAP